MRLFDKNFKEIMFSQSMAVIGGLIAGTLLAIYTDKILLIPGMIILLPGFLEMRGNISGSMSARLTSGLFLGVVEKEKKQIIRGNVIAAFLLTSGDVISILSILVALLLI